MPPIPFPEPGLVINYAYLWRHERRAGLDEGRKDRPSVIVLTSQVDSGCKRTVTVLPITHRPPGQPDRAVEIPLAVKKHLGLDDQPSWIILDEGNQFIWPGYDLRRTPGTGRYDYGFIPPALFRKVRDAFVSLQRMARAETARRD